MLMTVLVDSYPVNVLSALVKLLRVYLGWNLEDNLLLILNKMRWKLSTQPFQITDYGRSIYICSEYSYISENEL